ncbi:UDP-N-acetylmuramoyl-tripeptide--D-alanyl-D-alanine ligase [Flavobacterium noncentrifugens]|uniref:UDP-N-acetylmuramoyl-tripeptide--D-alanyl-D-alanine ligase n=1 Tax=Flavobacterium noncentrifugens TaxID=1128970 RepID=A0A1G8USM5_9FLAO|nr:UDP-N-acetylmuramoyl-tripeptide--D-alanyl-D-alanine ligase [Flavobacterium noncentrifugens]GEP52613.1 UDP-N-acetylmuramoyl-tripeptide--D-alanyl-D-alanine ligase [Flavobacterium noncentrifugens]SDJ55960.1 UDP-N-acetylmuramoyl-tripeptide--D-alanyl-D-alanine ligase [Flavobacterium noncentrifugens]
MDIQNIHRLFLACPSVSIDTRKIEPKSFFVAIKGENFDANTFAKEALEKGASYVMIDNSDYFIDSRTILVDESLSALQELAKFHRQYLKVPIVALTGSNGKTTTKELINAVLSQKYNTKATVGNLNNHIGVPLTLLSFNPETEIGIVEMGANHQKEIEFLCELAQPDFGYITNFGKAHLEGFGGVEGVIKGKSEMYQYLAANDKMAFVNFEDPIQAEKSKQLKSFTFGLNRSDANLNITSVTANPFVSVSFEDVSIQSQLIGLYNANNINAAIAIGKYFEVVDESIKQALESYIPANNRSQLMVKNGNEIILDAYNANPSSMAVAIENFLQLDKPEKVMILGDMFELGNESLQEHHNIVDSVRQTDDVSCYFIGKDFYANKIEKDNFTFYKTFDELASELKRQGFRNKIILIKGSRGMALERALESI